MFYIKHASIMQFQNSELDPAIFNRRCKWMQIFAAFFFPQQSFPPLGKLIPRVTIRTGISHWNQDNLWKKELIRLCHCAHKRHRKGQLCSICLPHCSLPIHVGSCIPANQLPRFSWDWWWEGSTANSFFLFANNSAGSHPLFVHYSPLQN